jgi:hypothetical protein
MNKLLLLIVLSLLSACGSGNIGEKVDQGQFLPFVQAFEASGLRYGIDFHGSPETIPINFGQPIGDGHILGQCDWNLISGKQIVIDQISWELLDAYSQKVLIYHELGHCVLGRVHRNDKILFPDDAGVLDIPLPASIMNMYLLDGYIYAAYPDYYESELFNNSVFTN